MRSVLATSMLASCLDSATKGGSRTQSAVFAPSAARAPFYVPGITVRVPVHVQPCAAGSEVNVTTAPGAMLKDPDQSLMIRGDQSTPANTPGDRG
jgi:hypothetical protein